MTIQEAIKSGKPFRRKGWPTFWEYDLSRDWITYEKTSDQPPIRLRDILADDWEVKHEPREWLIVGVMTALDGRTSLVVDGPDLSNESRKIRVREVLVEG
jgi:hypothetical protein